MAMEENKTPKTEYIENGDFQTGGLGPWKVLSGSVAVRQEGSRFHALFGPDAKLNQYFNLADVAPRQFTLTVDIRVEGGSDEATGKVQLIWFSGLVSRTFMLVEASEWRTVEIPVFLSSPTSANNLEVLVQPSFTPPVSIRGVSLRDHTGTAVKLDGAVVGPVAQVPADSPSLGPGSSGSRTD